MEIRITYKGITENGIKGIWVGFKPKGIEITEEIPILYADEGKILHKEDIYTTFTVLSKGETEEGWEEIPIEEYKKIKVIE